MDIVTNPLPFNDFESASRAVLAFLHDHYNLALWMITRTEGEDWIILHAEDHAYGIQEGTVLPWTDSFCCHMVNQDAPRLAPNSRQVTLYANAPLSQRHDIQAYIGVPLTHQDGALFGTLCALDPHEHPELGPHDLRAIELLAQLLSTLLHFDLKAVEQDRRAARVENESLLDPLTGLRNHRGWEHKMSEEEARAQRLGSPICVFYIDLDDLKSINDNHGRAQGDLLLRRTTKAIQESLREIDIAARVGGDEFTILALECTPQGSEEILVRLKAAFKTEGISASIGKAMRIPKQGLPRALEQAEHAMQHEKAQRRATPRRKV